MLILLFFHSYSLPRSRASRKSFDYTLRKAKINDIPILVKHHHLMFEEINSLENIKGTFNWQGMASAYRDKLSKQLDNFCTAFVIENEDKIIASGAVSIVELVPVPKDTNTKLGYIHSIYTDKNFRKNGFAQLIMQQLIKTCKLQGIKRIKLATSLAAKKLYKKLEFELDQNSMSLFIK